MHVLTRLQSALFLMSQQEANPPSTSQKYTEDTPVWKYLHARPATRTEQRTQSGGRG